MAKILNIETSTRVCSVALSEGDKILSLREKYDTFEHAKILHPFIVDVLSEAKVNYNDLDAVAVSEGPGSYTGLRIGVSAAKGICYAQNTPLIAVSTLQAMAMHAIEELNNVDAYFAPMIDARRMEVYSAVFDSSGRQLKKVSALIIDPNSFADLREQNKIYYFGDGAEKCRDTFKDVDQMHWHDGGFPSAAYMNKLAQTKFSGDDFVDVAYFEPFYLKDFIAAKPKVKGLDI